MNKTPLAKSLRFDVRRFLKARTTSAAVIYIALCSYLYYPQFADFQPLQYLIMLNSIIAALGCFVLSRRWISAYPGSLFAGIVYGFSPMAFGFASYHPLAGIPLAALPWLFCPAAFWRKTRGHQKLSTQHGRTSPAAMISASLCLLPFVAIILFFWLSANQRILPIFPVPVQQKLTLANMAGLAVPLTLKPHEFIFGFYHVPLIAFLMGLCMYVALDRPGIAVMAGISLVLSFSNPILQVSPIVWALIPLLFGAILVGLGMEGLAWGSASDCNWILFCIISAAVIAAGCFYLAIAQTSAYREAAIMHAMAAVLAGIIFFGAKANLRMHLLRWILMCAGLGIDIILSARYIVNQVF